MKYPKRYLDAADPRNHATLSIKHASDILDSLNSIGALVMPKRRETYACLACGNNYIWIDLNEKENDSVKEIGTRALLSLYAFDNTLKALKVAVESIGETGAMGNTLRLISDILEGKDK